MVSPRQGARPKRIGDILLERIDALGWGPRLHEEEVLAGWDAAVGPSIAAHARPSHIVSQRLTVVTESPVWTQQLSLLKPEILRSLAARFGPGAVTDLFFVTGKLEAPAPPPAPPPARRPPASALPPPLERELGQIPDPGVRESVRRSLLAALADEENPAPEPAP